MNYFDDVVDQMCQHSTRHLREDHDRSLTPSLAMQRRTNPARVARAALVFSLIGSSIAGLGQGFNNLWLGGFDSDAPPPFGGLDLDFQSGSMELSTITRTIGYRTTSANITDVSGNLLFSTNGTFVANALGDTMLNGAGLNPGPYANLYPEGLFILQGALILPKPDSQNQYLLFHMTVDDNVIINAEQLYLTTVDMSLDGGLGGVVSKNQVILSDDLNLGYLTAVRHANGRDWWAFCHKLNTDLYYRFIITPSGVTLDGTQAIGIVRPPDNGQACFSPGGSRFAYYWGEQDLDVFDFDRCTGLFSNPLHFPIEDYNGAGGVAFSPNGRFLYVSSVLDVYQFDMEAADIPASMTQIAHWDSTYSPFPPLATLFNVTQLAPDGEIYISTDNSTDVLHVIHDPDEPGVACNMEQHGITLPRYFANSLPNHPNYHLGPIDGSVCDSLGINVGLQDLERPMLLQSFPNPNSGQFTLSYPAQSAVGELEVRDLSGRIVRSERIPQWSTVHRVSLDHSAEGLYMCRIRWQEQEAVVRLLVVE